VGRDLRCGSGAAPANRTVASGERSPGDVGRTESAAGVELNDEVGIRRGAFRHYSIRQAVAIDVLQNRKFRSLISRFRRAQVSINAFVTLTADRSPGFGIFEANTVVELNGPTVKWRTPFSEDAVRQTVSIQIGQS